MGFEFSKDPVENFLSLFESARKAGVLEPSAMQLATIKISFESPTPNLRTVLYKGIYRGGFSFFTNLESPKAKELKANPNCSLVFFWAPLAQQIRISAQVDRLTRAEDEAYFKTRPRLSQLGAWASKQSSEIESYEFLEKKTAEMEKKFAGKEIPCPENWGGYRCVPLVMEFWFGKEGRLHERFVFERPNSTSSWRRYLKSP